MSHFGQRLGGKFGIWDYMEQVSNGGPVRMMSQKSGVITALSPTPTPTPTLK